MVKQDLLILGKGIPSFRKFSLSLLLFFSFMWSGFGQSQIACNDGVQVSLDGDCQAVITPDMILEGQMAQYAPPFTLRISGTSVVDNNTSSPIVTSPGTYNVSVTNSQGNSCWGQIYVEDKLPPVVECACPPGSQDEGCVFDCTDEAAFHDGTLNISTPAVTENCSDYTTTFQDRVIALGQQGCEGRIIERTWTYTDASGNSASCISEYFFAPADVADVTLAAPYNTPIMTCGVDVSMAGVYSFFRDKLFTDYLPSFLAGVPGTYPNEAAATAAARAAADSEAIRYAYPTINGVALDGKVCNILASKSDVEVEACNGCADSKKVIRTWTVLDWCDGDSRTLIQIINATDEDGPTIDVDDLTVSVDPWTCSSTTMLPAPKLLIDKCDANPTYSVQAPLGVIIRYDAPSKRYLIIGAPKGIHTILYIAKDCCGNETTAEMQLTVLDLTPPVAIAKQHIVVSLTSGGNQDGVAKLFANSVDNGSYDSCTPVHLEVRREYNLGENDLGCGYSGNYTYNDDGHSFDGSSNPKATNYDPDHGAYVKFCCEDITNTDGVVPFGIVKVWLRVWDDGDMDGTYGSAGDNFNETWVEVRVEDKLQPQIICPPNVTVNCDDDITNLNLTGSARAFSNCLDLDVTYSDRSFLNACGVGYIDRTWKISNNPSVACVQRITVENPHGLFNESNITWPQSEIVTNCADDAMTARPTWTQGVCDQIGMSVKSDTFFFEGNACLKILNTYTILDWCQYDPNSSSTEGYYSFTQVIKVIDDEKPVLASCDDLMFENNTPDCTVRDLQLSMSATDQGQCASDWLKWVVFVDIWGDGKVDYEYSSFLPANATTFVDRNGNGIPDVYVSPTDNSGTIRITLPEDIQGSMSNHKVTWRVTDGCGNSTSCTQNFMVSDKKKPTPYCLNISSALMNNGMVELWAADFNLGSFDNCTPQRNLLYTFNEEHPVLTRLNETHYFKGKGQNATLAEYNAKQAQIWLPASKSSGMVFNCDDLPSVNVKMTVWDEKLNFDFCIVELVLNDNQGACVGGSNRTISGSVTSAEGKMIDEVEVVLDNGTPEMLKSVLTSSSGLYAFSTPMFYDYNISGHKNDDVLNGVSTLDLVLIQRHLLDVSRFANPYHVIAADVNNDARITASDLVELRRVILGVSSKFNNNTSWRFVDSHQTFADINSPWPLFENLYVNNLSHDVQNQNFVGIKVGDVNGSAKTNALDPNTEVRNVMVLETENTILDKDTRSDITLSADVREIYGAQFTLTVNQAKLDAIYIGGQKMDDSFVAQIDENTYTVSWNNIQSLSGDQFITLSVTPESQVSVSDIISIHSSVTSAEMYTGDALTTSRLSLRFAGQSTEESFVLYQNEPNPFTDKTMIQFNLPEAADATLKVFNATGQVIYVQKRSFSKGLNSFTLERNELPASGVMIYQVESGEFTSTRKMIGLE